MLLKFTSLIPKRYLCMFDNKLTPEQLAVIDPVSDKLQDSFFDAAGRLDEKEYVGQFAVEAYKASLFLHRDHGVPQFYTYKHIRQQYLKISDFNVAQEYNQMHNATLLGIQVLKESLAIQ